MTRLPPGSGAGILWRDSQGSDSPCRRRRILGGRAALPGCVSQGETVEEVRLHVREAIEGWLLAEDATVRAGATDQVIEVAV